MTESSKHENPHVRLSAIQSLSKINDPRSIPILLAALDDTEPLVRATVATALGKLQAGQAKWQLLERLGDDDVEVRLAVIEALGRISDPDAVPGLLLTLRNEQGSSLKIAAIDALSKIGGAAALAVLEDAARDGVPEVQEAASRAVEASKREGAKREEIRERKTERIPFKWLLAGLFVVVLTCGLALSPRIALMLTSNSTTNLLMPTPNSTSASSLDSTTTPSPMPEIYVTLNVNEYSNYMVYWKQPLWESAAGDITGMEGFEHEEGGYGTISFPYLTGNGFLLTGDSSAQTLQDSNLLESGALLHFRDWENGLTVAFPNEAAAHAFGFNYRSNETWQLTFNNSEIVLPRGRGVFVGIVIHNNCPAEFVLLGPTGAQGGLSVDNILYVSHSTLSISERSMQ